MCKAANELTSDPKHPLGLQNMLQGNPIHAQDSKFTNYWQKSGLGVQNMVQVNPKPPQDIKWLITNQNMV